MGDIIRWLVCRWTLFLICGRDLRESKVLRSLTRMTFSSFPFSSDDPCSQDCWQHTSYHGWLWKYCLNFMAGSVKISFNFNRHIKVCSKTFSYLLQSFSCDPGLSHGRRDKRDRICLDPVLVMFIACQSQFSKELLLNSPNLAVSSLSSSSTFYYAKQNVTLVILYNKDWVR